MNSQWATFFNGKDLETAPESCWKSITYQTRFDGIPKSWQELRSKVLASRARFAEKDPSEFIECSICGFCGREIASHVKMHGINPKDYGITKSQACRDIIGARVKGEANPAYQHGGKFSPFSDKFIKYQNGEVEYTREEVNERRKQTVKENPQNQSTRIEYYLAKGLSEEEAKEALSERQTTFSKEKCVKKYGEEEGIKIWRERQERWQNTLSSKPPEEIADINRRKVAVHNYRTYAKMDTPGCFYIIENERGIKIGITTRGLEGRYGKGLKNYNIILKHEDKISSCFKIEFLLKMDEDLKQFKYNGAERFGGWTEVFDKCDKEVILNKFNFYKENFENELKERYPKLARY